MKTAGGAEETVLVAHCCTMYNIPLTCVSDAKVPNGYGPYAYCSSDKTVACAYHIQLPTRVFHRNVIGLPRMKHDLT